MRLLDLPQAKHFCSPSAAVRAGVGSQSLGAFHRSIPRGVVSLKEGTERFQVHQVNLIDSVGRWLLYSLGHYRRSIDMLVPVSAPWAHVTLYYASFFAANAILGIFGGWIGSSRAGGSHIVDVERGGNGAQELRIHRSLKSPNGAQGSHRAFWEFFYSGAATISAWAPAELAYALVPVNGEYGWQIMERNNVNYDMFHAWSASMMLHETFKPAKLNTLRGPLRLQLEATERIIQLAVHFAKSVSLGSDALVECGAAGTQMQIQKRLASQRPPHLVTQSKFESMLDL